MLGLLLHLKHLKQENFYQDCFDPELKLFSVKLTIVCFVLHRIGGTSGMLIKSTGSCTIAVLEASSSIISYQGILLLKCICT
ncbi:Os07g0457500 [Oryza sativa Japonica Group]|uniref:Os07g0457500 protein n=2 Tax=Oryza sativa subsp. japonica TaxID=39947 RepID=Q0D6P4_ORYSJ|nr:hypothetical protein EE612_038999 [Oryza sativa]BAF21479.1 Os07g0457500 [Oryza sativa Japonica Group]BAT01351.1 Os07g0457500 [Oryza sativa Japonica Group]|eukprot:NP_001059565.1 Os07g0457500 [Oryza sativa Japonica Group]